MKRLFFVAAATVLTACSGTKPYYDFDGAYTQTIDPSEQEAMAYKQQNNRVAYEPEDSSYYTESPYWFTSDYGWYGYSNPWRYSLGVSSFMYPFGYSYSFGFGNPYFGGWYSPFFGYYNNWFWGGMPFYGYNNHKTLSSSSRSAHIRSLSSGLSSSRNYQNRVINSREGRYNMDRVDYSRSSRSNNSRSSYDSNSSRFYNSGSSRSFDSSQSRGGDYNTSRSGSSRSLGR